MAHFTRFVMPKRVTENGEAHLCVIAPSKNTAPFEEMSQQGVRPKHRCVRFDQAAI